jgi:hypothetical protein
MAMPFLSIRAAKGLSQAAALSVLAASGLIIANPGSAEAAAGACGSGSYSIADLMFGSFECEIGDKKYSNFAFSGLSTGAYTFSLDAGTGDHVFSGSGLNYSGAGFTYQYKVSLLPSALPGQAFKSYNTGYSGSSTTNAAYKFKKVLSAYAVGGVSPIGSVTAENVVAVLPAPIGIVNAIVTDGPYAFAPGETGPIVFKNTVTRPTAGGRIDVITDSVKQLLTPGDLTKTPAPLPILGAGAAFGLSRKLRRRIKLA